MRTLVTGATGFVGRRLLSRLERPVVLSRDVEKAQKLLAKFSPEVIRWDPLAGPPPKEAFDGVDSVIHLAGDSVADGRWSAAKKQRILESRTIGTGNLCRAIAELPNKPAVLVSASAVGYYGSRGDEVLTESSSPGNDFLADVCVQWEQACQPAVAAGVRVVHPRIGLVLGPGGALEKMLPPFKLGIGGRLGSGRQWMPWIHLDDLVGMMLHAIQTSSVSGAMNAAAPQPITNAQFTAALGRVLHRPVIFPAPYFALRLAFGEFATVLFASQRVEPRVALASGYAFQFTDIDAALKNVLAILEAGKFPDAA